MEIYVIKKIYTEGATSAEYYQMCAKVQGLPKPLVLTKDKQTICAILDITLRQFYARFTVLDYEYQVGSLVFKKMEDK